MVDIIISDKKYSINGNATCAFAPYDDEHKVLWLSSTDKLIISNADAENIKNDITGGSGKLKIIVLSTDPAKNPHYNPETKKPAGTGEESAIYLATNTPSEPGNLYTEWIYKNSAWEKIGSADIDLSNYYTKSETYSKDEITSYLASKADISDTYTKEETIDAINSYGNNTNAFNYIKQLDDYFFEVEYSTENINQEYCYNYFSTSGDDDIEIGGACTAVYHKGKVLRQYDWLYDEQAEFLVRRPKDIENNKYSNIGIATAFPYFSKSFVESRKYSEKYKLLAFSVYDGINECGLYIQGNVTPKKQQDINITHTSSDYKGHITTNMIARIVLDNCDTLEHAKEELKKYDITRTDRISNDYDLHWLIADSTGNHAILEFTENGTGFNFISYGADSEILTNFNVDVVNGIEEDTFALDWEAISNDNIHNAGLERWEIAASEILKENPDFNELREKLKFTKFYTLYEEGSPVNELWHSEFSGLEYSAGSYFTPKTAKDAKTDATVQALYAPYFNIIASRYDNRVRGDQNTWQTVHSVIYDLDKKTLDICIQERNESKTYSLDNTVNAYTKEETVELINSSYDKILENIIDDEIIVSYAINELNENKATKTALTYLDTTLSEKIEQTVELINSSYNKLLETIIDDEITISYAINELNENIINDKTALSYAINELNENIINDEITISYAINELNENKASITSLTYLDTNLTEKIEQRQLSSYLDNEFSYIDNTHYPSTYAVSTYINDKIGDLAYLLSKL